MKKSLLSLFLFLIVFLNAFGQNKTITGTITDKNNNALANVTISAKGTDLTTKSDELGKYSLEISATVTTLEFTHADMKPSSATVGFMDVVDVVMVPITSDDFSDMSLEDLMNIKISVASNSADNLYNTVSTVSVIDRKTIEKFNYRTVAEALQTVPGFDIYRTYLKRNIPTARGVLQDNYANKVLLMINGISTWNAVTGEGSIDRINMADVERIEILKGPSSVLYGSNAFSGAINVVLKESGDYTNSTYGTVGDNGKLGVGSQVLLKTETGSLFISGNIDTENGYSYKFHDELDSVNNLNEYIKSKNITASLQEKNYSFLANYYQVDESYLGVTPSFKDGAGNVHKSEGFLASFTTSYDIAKSLKLKYLLNYDWNTRDLSRTANDEIRSKIDGYRLTNQASIAYTPTETFSAELGGSTEYKLSSSYNNYFAPTDTIITNNQMDNVSLKTYSAFALVNYSLNKFNFTVGSRYTYNDLFKDNLSSRITVVYKVSDKSSVKAIYGESFRAPSIFEQYFTTASYTVVGNKNLVPEKSRSFELLYLQSFEKVFIQATLYHSIYDNTISRKKEFYQPANKIVSIYENGNQFTANGIETELRYFNPKWIDGYINLNYIAGNQEDKVGDHYNFKYVPIYTCAVGLSKQIQQFSISSALNLKGATKGPFGNVDEAYMININVGFFHHIAGKKINHSFSAKNITNSEYQIPEYVRREKELNEVPYGYFRSFVYTLKVEL